MEKRIIRRATLEDAAAILGIYETYITDTVVTFEIEVPSLAAFRERMETIMEQFPWLVCEIDGKVAGYAYASKHGERAAYRWSADLSVYIHEVFHRKHIASELYDEVIRLLQKQGYYTVYAGVSTPNPRSEAFHDAYGFRNLGEFKNVGYKMGQWLGVTWYELPIAAYRENPEEPLPIGKITEDEGIKKL